MLDAVIELLIWLKAQGTPGQLAFFCGVILPIVGLIWGTRNWAKRRYDVDISQVQDLRDQLANRDETLANRDARIKEHETQARHLPESFLKSAEAEARDGNLEREIALSQDYLDTHSEALFRAYSTLTNASILDAAEDGAIGFENARLYNMGARAAKPRDRETRELGDELKQAAAAASKGLRVALKDDEREARREKLKNLPNDMNALSDRFYAAREAGLYQLMEAFALHGHRMARRAGGPGTRDALMFTRHVAEAEWFNGRYSAALDRLRSIQSAFLDAFQSDTLAGFYFRYLIAACLQDTGEPAKALDALTTLLQDRIRLSEEDHPDTLVNRYRIATCLQGTGEPAKALDAARTLLEDWIRIGGEEHPETLTNRGLIASCLLGIGEPTQALDAAKTLLEDQTRISGKDHPHTLATRYLIAYCLRETGEPTQALDSAKNLLEDRIRISGEDHPDTLTTRTLIAACLQDTGEPDKALDAARTLLDDMTRIVGEEHPNTLTTRYLFASCLQDTGEPAMALNFARTLLENRIRIIGESHPNTLATRYLIADCLRDTGEIDEALAQARDLLPSVEAKLGPDHCRTLRVRTLIARLLLDHGNPDKAREIHAPVVSGFRAVGIKDAHPDLKRALELDAELAQA